MNRDDKIRDASVGALVVSEPNEYPFLASPRSRSGVLGVDRGHFEETTSTDPTNHDRVADFSIGPQPTKPPDLSSSYASCSGTAAVGRGVGDGRAQGRTSDWSKAEEPQVKIQVTGENFCVGVDRRCATRTFRFSLFEIDLRASTIEGYAWTELDRVYVWFAPIYSTVTLRKGHILPGAMIVPS
ncbi:hypothetical protein HZH68_007040 [Vespula germanica]|uniref:Uncharacterized protein n=1 Tax=Vespula germanica TaxID=30212 RepID=A0A834N909_VESGE|nr:hypothetical protein HZH68_007040 [Vespula germanica]